MKHAHSPRERRTLLQGLVENAIERGHWDELKQVVVHVHPAEVAGAIRKLNSRESVAVFRLLPRNIASRLFAYLSSPERSRLLRALAENDLTRLLPDLRPDDRTQLLEEMPTEVTRRLLQLMPANEVETTRRLLGYPPGTAGRAMTTGVLTVVAGQTVGQAITHLRSQIAKAEPSQVIELVDGAQRLVGELTLATLFASELSVPVDSLERRPLISLHARASRDEVLDTFRRYRRMTIPVVDDEGLLLGVVTLDDALREAQERETRTVHRSGGMESLDGPYLQASVLHLVRKRGGWLSALFLSEMLTATAMGHYQSAISHAVVLALFVPLIISSGGNSGSQAATLIVRALALHEVTLSDWWRVMRRELCSGLVLGTWLGAIGFTRVIVWQELHFFDYGPNPLRVAVTIWVSLIGVVLFGGLAGSLMPLLLKRLRFDPAVSSAPFVATLVDVTGLVIYFTVAGFVLSGVAS